MIILCNCEIYVDILEIKNYNKEKVVILLIEMRGLRMWLRIACCGLPTWTLSAVLAFILQLQFKMF